MAVKYLFIVGHAAIAWFNSNLLKIVIICVVSILL